MKVGAGLGTTVATLRERTSKRARDLNCGCALLQLLDRSPDIRHALLTEHVHDLGLVTLWRLKLVSRQWNSWINAAMRLLPALVVQGGHCNDTQAAAGLHDCLFALTFAQMRWTVLPRTNVPERQFHAACSTANGDILLAGGTRKVDLPGEHPLGSRVNSDSRSVEVYCGGSWRTTPAIGLPTAVRRACMVSLRDGSLLVLGGSGGDAVARADVWRLWLNSNSDSGFDNSRDVDGNSPGEPSAWKPRASMHTARSDFACGVLPDGRVVVAGGLGNAPDYLHRDHLARRSHLQVMLQSAEVYDPANDRWSCLPPMRYPRSACRGCVDRLGRFIVSGGRGIQEGPLTVPLDSVECFLPYARGQRAARWVEYSSQQCSAGGAEEVPPPLRCRSVGHSMVCIAGDLIVIGPAFSSSIGGGGGSTRGGVGAGISSGSGFGAMILMGSDHCPGKAPRWRSLRLPIPCRGRQCTAIVSSIAGCNNSSESSSCQNFLGERQSPIPPALTQTEVEVAWAALTKLRAVKLCVELLAGCPAAECSRSSCSPIVAFSAMFAEQTARTQSQVWVSHHSSAVSDASEKTKACATLFRAPLLSKTSLLQGLRTAGAAARLARWSIPLSVSDAQV